MEKIKLSYKTVIMLLLVSVLLTACPEGSWYSKIYIDQESKDYCLFDQGSYWIYQDSATLAIEKVVIDNPIERTFQLYMSSSDGGHRGETYSTMISSYSQNSKLSFNLTLSRIDFSADCLFIKDNDDTNYSDPKFKNSLYHNNQRVLLQDVELWLFEKKDDYMINGITFNNIKIFQDNYFEKKRMYYWAKNIGLIRVERYDEKDSLISVSNLIRYDVKPYKQ